MRLITYCLLVVFLVAPASRTANAAPPGAAGDLYVSSDALNVTGQYDGPTGVSVGPFYVSVMGVGQLGVHFGATNSRVLIGHWSGGVDEFDSDTGAYIKTYNPGGGTQWAGLYGPTGDVYIGSWTTDDVRVYDSTTGAFMSVLTTIGDPADMRIGPNGNLYICSYVGSYVKEVDAVSGALVGSWSLPFGARTNDIAFLPSGEILVTAMGTNQVHRFDSAYTPLGSFYGTAGWGRPHGIDISPWDGNIYVADGLATQVFVFDPVTFAEITPAFLSPLPGGKIVDLEFKPNAEPQATEPSTWGGVKGTYRP